MHGHAASSRLALASHHHTAACCALRLLLCGSAGQEAEDAGGFRAGEILWVARDSS